MMYLVITVQHETKLSYHKLIEYKYPAHHEPPPSNLMQNADVPLMTQTVHALTWCLCWTLSPVGMTTWVI